MIDFKKYSKTIEEKGAEYADLRILKAGSEAYVVKDGILSSIQSGDSFTFGVRTFYRGGWGFSFGYDTGKIKEALMKSWKMAKINSGKIKKRYRLRTVSHAKDSVPVCGKTNPLETDMEEKIRHALEFDRLLKRKNVKSRTTETVFSASESWFFNSKGAEILEPRYGFNLRLGVAGKGKNGIANSFERKGKTGGYELFQNIDKFIMTERLHTKFLNALEAKQAPAGRFPVVIDNDLCGVFFHEAVGHACEADAVHEKASVFQDMLNKKIGPDFLNLTDTPNVENEGGFFRYDSEGMPAGKTHLIKNGVLKNLINSLETANITGAKPTGNGRAQNPSNIPIPRMTNTVLHPGPYKKDELFEGIKKGIYALGSSGGVVEPINGNFVFNAGEAYLIENGQITTPLKDVSLAGNITEILPMIEKIADDQIPNYFGGRCGKKGQLVPVGEKTPHIKISEAMIGGTNS